MITICDIYWLHYLCKYRAFYQSGNSFEGKEWCIVNNDGTVSSGYEQGVNKYSNGLLIEGSSINSLCNGKANFKWRNGDREISEILNDKRHGTAIRYDFDGKIKMGYYSNGKKIFLL